MSSPLEPLRPLDLRISLQKLDVFCTVVELNSITEAAKTLFLTQPVVSAHIKSLEQRVGAPLFERHGRGLRLTEAGSEAHRWAQDTLQGFHRLHTRLDELQSGLSGTIRIGAGLSIGSYLLPGPIAAFQKSHPQTRIRTDNSTVEMALEGVSSGRLDFAFVALSEGVDSTALLATPIGHPKYALLASTDDHTTPDSLALESLPNLTFIAPPSGLSIRRNQDIALAAHGIATREVALELGSAEAIKAAVRSGAGVALLWRSSALAEIREGTLREVTIIDADLYDSIYAVRHRTATLSRAQELAFEALQHDMAATLATTNT